MGWLKDLMRDSMQEQISFQDLARRMRDSHQWPEAEAIQANSLGVKLSKIDKGGEIGWLRKRADVQGVLIDVLGCAADDFEVAMERAGGPSADPSYTFRLEDLPGSDPVDLVALKTGIPGTPAIMALFGARAWNTWWAAPGGSGRTLVGQWLEAQRQARHIRGADLAKQTHGGNEPWFINLATLEELLLIEPHHIEGRIVCIGAPFEPPRLRTRGWGMDEMAEEDQVPDWFKPDAWKIVTSPSWGKYADEFLDWIETLTQGRDDAAFKRAEAELWFEEEGVNLVDCLGTAIGLCGLINKYGTRGLRTTRAEGTSEGDHHVKLAGRFVRMKLEEASFRRKNESAEALGDHAVPLLQGVTRGMLLEDGGEMHGRTIEEWARLVGPELVFPPDRSQLLARIESAKSLEQLRQELEMQPTPHQAVKHLVETKLLRPDIWPDTYALRPRWMAAALCNDSLSKLLGAAPEVWGKAALHTSAAANVLELLHRDVKTGSVLYIEQVLKTPNDTSPAWVAALECVFRAAGIAVLEGTALPHQSLLELWQTQMNLVFWRQDGLPFARLHYPNSGSGSPWLAHGTWLLAALALSERLADSIPADSALAPWGSTSVPGAMAMLLEQIQWWRPSVLPWQPATLALMGRLYDRIGPVRHPDGRIVTWHTVFGLLDIVRAGRSLTRADVAALDHQTTKLPLLREEAARREVPWSMVARAFMDYTFQEDDHREFLKDAEYRGWFWPHLDPVTLAARLKTNTWFGWPYDLFTREHWQVVADLFRAGRRDRNIQMNWPFRDLGLWRAMPQDFVLALAREGCFHWSDREILAVVCGRCLDEMLDVILDLVAHPEDADYAFSIIVHAVPSAEVPTVLARLKVMSEGSNTPLPFEESLQNYLHYIVRDRKPGWEDAFELLHRREEICGRAAE